MNRSRFGMSVVAAVLSAVTLTSSCSNLSTPPTASARANMDSPSVAVSRTPAAPTKPAKPSPTATPTPTKTVIQPASSIQPAKRATQQGFGPAGSAKSTGSDGVALTFDDGPDPVYTPQLLDLLKQNGVKATFCLVGRQAKKYPGLVKRIAAEGHTLCNHSWSHRFDLGKLKPEEIATDLRWTNNAIRAAVPNAKIKYFRAPGGYFTTALAKVTSSMGMKSIYWGLDTRDWDFAHFGRGVSMINHIISVITSGVRPGTIVLAHDYRKPDSIAAFRVLLPWLKPRLRLIPLPI